MNVNWLFIPTLAISGLFFVVGAGSIRCCGTPAGKAGVAALWLVLGIPGFLFPLYYLHGFDHAKWFYEFRSLPGAELTAAGAGLFAGALAELMRGSRWFSRPFWAILLGLGIVAPYLKPVIAPLPSRHFLDHWQDGVCLQSTQASCGAACAATVFRMYGFELTEREIARECHTCLSGTENWYLARAFRRRGCVVTYRLTEGLPTDLRLPALAGIRVGGIGHFIVIKEHAKGRFVIGDPLAGRQEVPDNQVTRQFDFTGFFMEVQGKHLSARGFPALRATGNGDILAAPTGRENAQPVARNSELAGNGKGK